MDTNKVLEMIFVADDGGKITISVPSPKEGLTDQEVDAVMDGIIEANIFSNNHGSLVEKSGARKVTKTIEEITLQ
ncbi:MAG TPA: DUF2922 domain-containing protein [Defluviitaleaceae bacterium]|jgi:hypothetical protein|nr:DUF2922 domain-containing protein [Candidatus Epulonipiscium sp.]HOA80052.1 DUF2922 domain-containing protein [Defluviitaleaceae bacterium]